MPATENPCVGGLIPLLDGVVAPGWAAYKRRCQGGGVADAKAIEVVEVGVYDKFVKLLDQDIFDIRLLVPWVREVAESA